MQPAYLAFSTVTIRAESICAYCDELVTNGRNGVGIRMVSFAPTAGPAAQQFPSWQEASQKWGSDRQRQVRFGRL